MGVSADAVCACGAQGKLCAVDSLPLGAKLRSAMLAFKGTSFPLSGFDGPKVSCVNFMVFYA